jgi:hypothetical protein
MFFTSSRDAKLNYKMKKTTQFLISPNHGLVKAITSLLVLTSVFHLTHGHYTLNPKYLENRQPVGKEGRLRPISYGTVVRSPPPVTDRQQQRKQWREPSCAQLRSLWYSSVQGVSNKLGFFVLPEDMGRILSNPYYRSLIKGPPRYGTIVTEARDESRSSNELFPEVQYGRVSKGPDSNEEEPDDPSSGSASFGKVIYSPSDVRKSGSRMGDAIVVEAPPYKDKQRQAKGKKGRKQVSDSASSAPAMGDPKQAAAPASKQSGNEKSERPNSDTLSANDILNSVWYDTAAF